MVLRRADRSGVAVYDLADHAALVAVVGRVPRIAPSYPLAVRAAGLVGLWAAIDRIGDCGLLQPGGELRRQLRTIEPALAAAGLDVPRDVVDEPASLLS
jgi:hypothetical protein